MRSLTRRAIAGTAVVVAAAMATAIPAVGSDGSSRHDGRHGGDLLRSDLVGSLTTDAVLAGVSPGGADWSVSRSSVVVRESGRFDAKVRRLVLTSTGANPVPTLSASLVCNGAVVDTVGPVAYDTAGNARIRGTFDVPDRCLAPAVLINPADRVGVYIAASGSVS
jgi:hypothetical protein